MGLFYLIKNIMKELIKVIEREGQQAVSLKELYVFLEIGENFTDWSKRMLGYGFEENIDYQAVSVFMVHENGFGGTNKKDFAISIDMAKEISMLQRSEKGKQARKYFIECEKKLKEVTQHQLPQTFSEALRLAAAQAEQIEEQQKQLTLQAPKVLFAQAVETSKQSCLIGELAKVLKQNGIEIGQNRLFEWLRKNGYLCNKGENYNLPTQRAMEMGLFEVKKGTVVNPDGSVRVTTTTKVTGKGSVYFINKFLNK